MRKCVMIGLFTGLMVIGSIFHSVCFSQEDTSTIMFRASEKLRVNAIELTEALNRRTAAQNRLMHLRDRELESTIAVNSVFTQVRNAMQNGLVSYSKDEYEKYLERCQAYAGGMAIVYDYTILGSTLYPVGTTFPNMKWYCTLQQGRDYSLYVLGDGVGAKNLVVRVYDSNNYLVLQASGNTVVKSYFSALGSGRYYVRLCSPDGSNEYRVLGTAMVVVGVL